jgi:hypothetical protein
MMNIKRVVFMVFAAAMMMLLSVGQVLFYLWQVGQKWVLRPPRTMRSTGPPQW